MKCYTRTHKFIGQLGTRAEDGLAGFQMGQAYELRYQREDNGIVVIELDHLAGGGQLAVTAGEFERWFRK